MRMLGTLGRVCACVYDAFAICLTGGLSDEGKSGEERETSIDGQ